MNDDDDKPQLTPALVVKLLAEGRTQVSIANEYHLTRARISQLARSGGRKPRAQMPVAENLPWDVDLGKHDQNAIYHALRAHVKAQLVGFNSVIKKERVKLLAMYRKLVRFNLVVDFDPQQEPIPGLSSTGGFRYVPRQPEDDGWIIRMKPGVKITKLGKKMWAMPDKLPE